MTCSLLRPVVISLVAVASGAASGAPVDVIFTNIPGHPTAAAPGVEGAVFRHPLVPFLTLGGSADGERWIFKAFIDAPDTSNDVIVVGHGLAGAVVRLAGADAGDERQAGAVLGSG